VVSIAWETAMQQIKALKAENQDLRMALRCALFDIETGNARGAKFVIRSILDKYEGTETRGKEGAEDAESYSGN
jgi:hypothetical protein